MIKSARAYFAEHTAIGKTFLSLGIIALIVDAVICYRYGVTQSTMHGLGFAVLAFFFALLPDAAASEIEQKRTINGIVLAALCIPLGLVAYQSHLGYSAGIRVGDIHQAAHKTNVKVNADDEIEQAKRDVAMYERKLAELSWLPKEVNANGLRSQIEVKTEAIRQEEKRGGCGAKCLALKTELAEIEKRKAGAEDVTRTEERLAAARTLLSKAKITAAGTETPNSVTVHQNSVAAQLYLAATGVSAEKAIEPDKVTLVFTNTAISGANSLAFMIMAPVGFFVAGRNRTKQPRPGVPSIPTNATHTVETRTIKERDPRMDTLIEAIRPYAGKAA